MARENDRERPEHSAMTALADAPGPCDALVWLTSVPRGPVGHRDRLTSPREQQRRSGVALATTAVAAYLGVDDASVRIGHLPSGAPVVVEPAADTPAISITHDGELVGCAVAGGCAVGLDAMRPRAITRLEQLAARHLSPAERERVAASTAPEAEFLRLWTRKEAVFKAAGTGITGRLANVDVSHDAVAEPSRHGGRRRQRWTVLTLPAPQPWIVSVALACEAGRASLIWPAHAGWRPTASWEDVG